MYKIHITSLFISLLHHLLHSNALYREMETLTPIFSVSVLRDLVFLARLHIELFWGKTSIYSSVSRMVDMLNKIGIICGFESTHLGRESLFCKRYD